MTIPDELVQAAAEAMSLPDEDHLMTNDDGVVSVMGTPADIARIALQAAFAKLPECERARVVVRDAVQNVGNSWLAADLALAALAREFGGQE